MGLMLNALNAGFNNRVVKRPAKHIGCNGSSAQSSTLQLMGCMARWGSGGSRAARSPEHPELSEPRCRQSPGCKSEQLVGVGVMLQHLRIRSGDSLSFLFPGLIPLLFSNVIYHPGLICRWSLLPESSWQCLWHRGEHRSQEKNLLLPFASSLLPWGFSPSCLGMTVLRQTNFCPNPPTP